MIIVSNRRKKTSYKGTASSYIETHCLLPADGWSPKYSFSINFLFKWIIVVNPQLEWKLNVYQMFLLTVINTVEPLRVPFLLKSCRNTTARLSLLHAAYVSLTSLCICNTVFRIKKNKK